MVEVGGASSHPTGKICDSTSHENLGCIPACKCGPSNSQRCIGCSRIDRLEALIIGNPFVVSTNTDGIAKARVKRVGFLQRSELPRCQCIELHIVQSVGRRVRGFVIHVRSEQAVAVGESVVDTPGEKVFVDHLLANECVSA